MDAKKDEESKVRREKDPIIVEKADKTRGRGPVQGMRVTKALLEKHGFTDECQGCLHVRGMMGYYVCHNDFCRSRIFKAELDEHEVNEKEQVEKESVKKEAERNPNK